MSAAQPLPARAPARTAPRPAPARPAGGRSEPRLRVVPPPARARTRVPFIALCMAVLASSLLAVLLLNTAMAQGEYRRYELATRLAQSAQAQQELVTRLDEAASPARLAARAESLGMVASTTGAYLRLADGAVLGDPTPAGR